MSLKLDILRSLIDESEVKMFWFEMIDNWIIIQTHFNI